MINLFLKYLCNSIGKEYVHDDPADITYNITW